MDAILNDVFAVVVCGVLSVIWTGLISAFFAMSVPIDKRGWQIAQAVIWVIVVGGGVALFVWTTVLVWR